MYELWKPLSDCICDAPSAYSADNIYLGAFENNRIIES